MTNLENLAQAVNRLQQLLAAPMEMDRGWVVDVMTEIEKVYVFRCHIRAVVAQKQASGEWQLDESLIPEGCPLDNWEICYALLRMIGFPPNRSTAQTNLLTGETRVEPRDEEMSSRLAGFIIHRIKEHKRWN